MYNRTILVLMFLFIAKVLTETAEAVSSNYDRPLDFTTWFTLESLKYWYGAYNPFYWFYSKYKYPKPPSPSPTQQQQQQQQQPEGYYGNNNRATTSKPQTVTTNPIPLSTTQTTISNSTRRNIFKMPPKPENLPFLEPEELRMRNPK